jgi:hypothetical protein
VRLAIASISVLAKRLGDDMARTRELLALLTDSERASAAEARERDAQAVAEDAKRRSHDAVARAEAAVAAKAAAESAARGAEERAASELEPAANMTTLARECRLSGTERPAVPAGNQGVVCCEASEIEGSERVAYAGGGCAQRSRRRALRSTIRIPRR